ncbi:hypothetical protein MADA3029_p0008 [Vibrio nigripulchritudo MADA3029]|uniref:hypothetical protein n=1 Tax=Vibrio nigripulchritudo TaxID=28173 RepID=UPI0003B197E3|nr:hypothetical protein [Vibrio nigripulchritudo]CCN38608.1 hypothetical protein VIBNIAM115_p0008 [Vibrio nigripulchritudo AM115]CCN44917.1 hypothetical protein VIBNIFTn2_p0007 [Vibrio nigripulchritudo FTn2]CCN50786.1 hypothetical protein VIBNIMADA3020_p0008 [Vibrio nigripulchritudo MADA3020]CCN56644.1 hypothetical protein VIBNIMADA3021_p0008 [Vibrio nigripulchritudo MADA3021]CCN62501.1 hypothetical protein MADA3029_p0008 [Vibrio nigripulchritudo MADA3029]
MKPLDSHKIIAVQPLGIGGLIIRKLTFFHPASSVEEAVLSCVSANAGSHGHFYYVRADIQAPLAFSVDVDLLVGKDVVTCPFHVCTYNKLLRLIECQKQIDGYIKHSSPQCQTVYEACGEAGRFFRRKDLDYASLIRSHDNTESTKMPSDWILPYVFILGNEEDV